MDLSQLTQPKTQEEATEYLDQIQKALDQSTQGDPLGVGVMPEMLSNRQQQSRDMPLASDSQADPVRPQYADLFVQQAQQAETTPHATSTLSLSDAPQAPQPEQADTQTTSSDSDADALAATRHQFDQLVHGHQYQDYLDDLQRKAKNAEFYEQQFYQQQQQLSQLTHQSIEQQRKEIREAEADLLVSMRDSLAEGDVDTHTRLSDQLGDLKTQKYMKEMEFQRMLGQYPQQPVYQPQQQTWQNPAQPYGYAPQQSPYDVVRSAPPSLPVHTGFPKTPAQTTTVAAPAASAPPPASHQQSSVMELPNDFLNIVVKNMKLTDPKTNKPYEDPKAAVRDYMKSIGY